VPRVLVELGTHNGVSYAAFCQAVARGGLATRCHAVGTWRGDAHAGLDGPDILDELRRFHDERFGAFSSLLQTTFNEALDHFEDRSIDLLHIDGLPTYEAVRRVFESWLPKLSDKAVVLFHDINVRDGDSGVARLWAELCQQYPGFAFVHGYGLGVMAVGDEVPAPIAELCELTNSAAIARIRSRFARLGEHWSMDTPERLLAHDVQHGAAVEASLGQESEPRTEAEERTAQAEGRLAEETQLRPKAEHRGAQTQKGLAKETRLRTEAEQHAAQAEKRLAQETQLRTEAEVLLSVAEQKLTEQSERLAKLERECEHLKNQHDAVLSSASWRLTGPLRKLFAALPGLRRHARRGGRLLYWIATPHRTPQRIAYMRARRGSLPTSVAGQAASAPNFVEGDAESLVYSRENSDGFMRLCEEVLKEGRIEQAEQIARTGMERCPRVSELRWFCRKLDTGRQLRSMGLFNPTVYRSVHHDLQDKQIDPWVHFLVHGLDEGRAFTNCEGVSRVLTDLRREIDFSIREFKVQAERALAAGADSEAAASLRRNRVRIGIFCSSEGNFFMQEIANLLAWGLQEQSIEVVQRDQQADCQEPLDLRIFVAPHEFFTLGLGRDWMWALDLPNTVLYNVEQLQSPWFCRALPFLLRAALVLDINFQSSEILRRVGCNAIHVMPGYVPQAVYSQPCRDVSNIELLKGYEFGCDEYNWRDRDLLEDRPIDLLFIGTSLPRRDRALHRLLGIADAHRFICVTTPEQAPKTAHNHRTTSTEINCALGQRAKIVLNIHRDWLGYFEWSRMVLQGFWQGACVVSDPCLSHPIFKPGIHYLEESTRHIGELIRWLLETRDGQEELNRIRSAGHRTAATLGSMRVALEPALEAFVALLSVGFHSSNENPRRH
jgi:hypothetical protein